MTQYEKETIINYNNEDSTATVFTYHRALISKLNKLVGVNPDIQVTKTGDEWIMYKVPKSWIKVSPPRQVNYTDKQRAALMERMANVREKRNTES